MIPNSKNNLPAMSCLSAMQKCIRRGLEMEAMSFAVELHHTSKNFAARCATGLRSSAHEDIDSIAAPWVITYVKAACDQARAWYDPKKLGKSRMAIGNCIRLMCRAPKSREGDHFHVVAGLRSLLEGFVPKIPDWADDQHTIRGKRLGGGLDYFRRESTRLEPAPVEADPYEDEAYRLWRLKEMLAARRNNDA